MPERPLHFREERDNLEAYLSHICQNRHPVALLLDRIKDVRNLGALFRIADAARLSHIYGYHVPALDDRKKLKRVARSTLEYVPFTPLHRIEEVAGLRSKYALIGLEITDRSIAYHRMDDPGPCILVVGNEQTGISEEMLTLTRQCIHIPMFGVNTSMNVAVATGIAVYGLLGKMGKLNS